MMLVPHWIRIWYLLNIMILTPEWAFIMLRPRSLEGGDLAFFFQLFHVYARVDKLFRDYGDRTVKYIYYLGGLDILACCYFFAAFRPDHPWFAIACICREVFVFTKTVIYLLYSYDFILPFWRFPVCAMNSQWCVIPLLAIFRIGERLATACKG